MQLIRGMSSLNTRKKKPSKKRNSLLLAEIEHEKELSRLGVKGKKPQGSPYKIPTYHTEPRVTSDSIPGNGTKKDRLQYTGDEIMGIVTTHKSNMMPIRKDNKTAAIDAAQMRR
jgi:hypothetical protein